MSEIAHRLNGEIVYANDFSDEEWQTYKDSYHLGELVMPCCSSPAIPKTSSNFLKFFAHYSDECASSPESIWHEQAKNDIAHHLYQLNLSPSMEYSGKNKLGAWRADIYFEFNNRKFAIEIQHSYQSLTNYLKRQERYNESSISCFWILYEPRYLTLLTSIGKYKIKTEFAGKKIEKCFFPCLPTLPILWFDNKPEQLSIKGPGLFSCSVSEFLISIIESKFTFSPDKGIWHIAKNA